jgi:4-hydroxy-3-methylbut-2-enyl diphosphate reductase
VEERAARRAGVPIVRVGLGAPGCLPEGRLVSLGLAGALVDGLEPGDLLVAREIVSDEGTRLWAGEPLSVPGARAGVVCAATCVVDDPEKRRGLAARTGADAVDMESAALAASGRLVGSVKAISDTPAHPVGRLARAATPAGEVAWAVVARAFVAEPLVALHAARGARRALGSLERAAAALARA